MYKIIVVEIKSCVKCGVMFPMYEDVKKDEEFCVKHRGLVDDKEK